jgi:hypothetical protein
LGRSTAGPPYSSEQFTVRNNSKSLRRITLSTDDDKKQWVGWADQLARPVYSIWLFSDCSVPAIIRKREGQDYAIVGNAWNARVNYDDYWPELGDLPKLTFVEIY